MLHYSTYTRCWNKPVTHSGSFRCALTQCQEVKTSVKILRKQALLHMIYGKDVMLFLNDVETIFSNEKDYLRVENIQVICNSSKQWASQQVLARLKQCNALKKKVQRNVWATSQTLGLAWDGWRKPLLWQRDNMSYVCFVTFDQIARL